MLALRYILAVLIRSVFMVVGIPGNGLIIIVYLKKQRKTGTDVLILGLAIVDFIVCVSFPMKIYSYVASQFTNDPLCKLMHFMVFWNTYIGVFLTAVITADRYIAVCKPLRRRVSPKQAIIILSVCAILAALSAIPSVAVTGIQTYGPISKCTYYTDNVVYAQVIAYMNDTLFYSCLTLITVLYVLIWIAVRRQAKVRVMKLGGISSVSASVRPTQVSVMPSEAWTEEQSNSSKPTTSGQAEARNGLVADSDGQCPDDVPKVPRNPSAGMRFDRANHLSIEPLPKHGTRSGNHLTPPGIDTPSPKSPTPSPKPVPPVPVVRTNNKTTIMIFIITVIFFVSWIPTKIWDYYPGTKFTWIQTDPVRYNIFYTSLFAINLNQVINPFVYSFVNVQFRRECVTVMRQIRQCRF